MVEVNSHEQTPSSEIMLLSSENVKASINSEGALLTSLVIGKTPVIYQLSKENTGRGGIPVLGPTPGPVRGTSWENIYPKMPSHGMDRISTWDISRKSSQEVVLSRQLGTAEFLFKGQEKMAFNITDSGIAIVKTITNHEDKPREIGHGFHPYYQNENSTWDSKVLNPENIEKLKNKEAVIITPGISNTTLETGKNKYRITSSPTPRQTVLWTDDFIKYVCFEPWWATVEEGVVIGPRESKEFTLSISQIT